MANKYWTGSVPAKDDFEDPIVDVFIDGKSYQGPWGLFTEKSYEMYGNEPDKLGLGIGQKYKKQEDGRWLKIEG